MKVLNPCRVFAVLLALLLPRLAGASEITERYSKFLLLADGDSSSGSASIIKFRGNALILTNAHVVSGNAITRFRQLNSHDVRASVFGVAQDRDIIVASQNAFTDGIEASEAVDKDVSIGDAIVVLGNSQGKNVVTEIEGRVIGLGPELVEVDAKFVSGNSGSPIIHVKTGKVIAVATFVTVKKADAISQDSPFAEVRRFAYRLDTVPKWQYCSPDRFAEEGVYVTNVQSHTADLMTLFKDLRDDGTLDPSNYTGRSNWTSGYVSTLGKGWPENRLQQLKFAQLAKEFTQHINSDIRGVNVNSFTVFHRDALVKELTTRGLLMNYFGNVQWSTVRFESWGLQQTAWTFNAAKR
jgi:hypothetical protein